MQLTRVATIHNPLTGNSPVNVAGFLIYAKVHIPALHGHDDGVGRLGSGFREPSEGDAC